MQHWEASKEALEKDDDTIDIRSLQQALSEAAITFPNDEEIAKVQEELGKLIVHLSGKGKVTHMLALCKTLTEHPVED